LVPVPLVSLPALLDTNSPQLSAMGLLVLLGSQPSGEPPLLPPPPVLVELDELPPSPHRPFRWWSPARLWHPDASTALAPRPSVKPRNIHDLMTHVSRRGRLA
jgi:hypothetical protein